MILYCSIRKKNSNETIILIVIGDFLMTGIFSDSLKYIYVWEKITNRDVFLTQGVQVPVGLQHHIPVQGPLNRIQAFPLFLSEFYSHILECKQSLKGNISPNEQGESSENQSYRIRCVRIGLAGMNVLSDLCKIILSKLQSSNFFLTEVKFILTKLATFKGE